MSRPMLVFGTRPEAIKLAPVVDAFRRAGRPAPSVCVTGQHRQMLDQVLDAFGIKPDHDLSLMRDRQTLFDVTAGALTGMRGVLEQERPPVVLVQGDTTTVFAASLAAFYLGIPVAHVEAGLRTFDKRAPFPEEMNRVLTSDLADYHFAPTTTARDNLLREGRRADRIWVTGNTVIDALRHTLDRVAGPQAPPGLDARLAADLVEWTDGGGNLVLVTGHRRESFGGGFERIALALGDVAAREDTRVVYPVHLNPNVREPVTRLLAHRPRAHLIEPLPYPAFVWLMSRATLILTDSGGIQEEAPALGKPVLVMRETTERPEAVAAGTARLVGTTRETIVRETSRLLDDPAERRRMASAENPYGDGRAADRIVEILAKEGLC